MSYNILFFGDSNTQNYLPNSYLETNNVKAHVENYPGLRLAEAMFDFYFTEALKDDDYDLVILSIGTNDIGGGMSKKQLESLYKIVKNDIYQSLIIVGPCGDINTLGLSTTDGVHFDKNAVKLIGERLIKLIE